MKFLKWVIFLILLLFSLSLMMFFRKDISIDVMKQKYADENSSFIEMEGMNMHYRKEGQGIPLLLIHGTSSSLHTWDIWASMLSDSFTIIRIDLPGFGLTGPHPNSDYSIEMYNRLLFKLLDTLKIDTCYVAGNSLGGYITWNMAVDQPGRVKKIILLDAVAYTKSIPVEGVEVVDKGHSLAFALARNPVTSLIARWVTPKFLVKSSLLEVYSNDSLVTDGLVERYYDMIRSTGNRKAFVDNVQSRKSEGKEVLLQQLSIPVLIQWGRDDHWVDVSMGKWFDAVIPQSEMIIYDHAGHVPMEEIPEITATDARRFLLDTY